MRARPVVQFDRGRTESAPSLLRNSLRGRGLRVSRMSLHALGRNLPVTKKRLHRTDSTLDGSRVPRDFWYVRSIIIAFITGLKGGSIRNGKHMTSRWRWLVRLLFRRIWFRAALFSIFSVALALLAAFVAPFVPYDISTKIGSDAVDNILGILASSMLAVTTFSLTAMVSAFSGASSTITPRATQLLVQDSTAQNALSTFLGAFLFSIVGICALSTGIYGKSGRVILFIGTILVIAIIVFTLLRWIEHLSSFGRVGSTIERIERVTKSAITKSGFGIRLTADAAEGASAAPGQIIRADEIGYVTHIDLGALKDLAESQHCPIEILVTPGAFVTPHRGLARSDGGGEKAEAAVRDAFTIEHHRQFDHDPRFGLTVLSEIASRALSPGVNDPGTAIAVLSAGVRIMAAFLDGAAPTDDESGSVRLPDLLLPDLLEDLIEPIARDGAGLVEVAIRLQRSLGEIAAMAPLAYGTLARSAAQAMVRNEQTMTFTPDLERVRAVYVQYWGTGAPGGPERPR